MSNLILRSIKDRGEKIFARISDQIRKDRLKSLYIFTGIIIIIIASYLIWFNFFNLHQVFQAPDEGENFLARITTGVKGAFADMFGLPDGNIIAEFPMRGLVARERQRVENHPFVSIDKDVVYPGGKIVKSGSGFTLNGEVIIFSSSPSGENKSVAVFADQSGQFNYSYAVQPSAEAGVYQYWAEDKTTRFIADRIRYLIVPIAQKDIASEKVTEILADDAKEDDKEIPSLALPKECSFSGAGVATSTKRIIINEVAWMGSDCPNRRECASNEWIELKNISSSEIDVSGWWLIDQGEQIKVVFPQNTIILAGRFLLFERTDDDSIPNVRADMIYQGILSNDEEGLRLLSPDCLIKDEVLANPKWPAGEAGSRKTMERATDFSSWQTSVFVNGTPKQRNSSGEVVFSGGNPATGSAGTATSASSQECSFPAVGMATDPKKVILNEIAWMGSTEHHSNEWIELKNISSSEIDISGWWLIDQREQIKVVFPQNTIIPAGRFFLLERADDDSVPNVRADIIYSNGGILSNDEEGLRLLNTSCLVEDEALASPKWPAGETSSRKTMERTADFLGWQTSAVVNGTPKQRNSMTRAVETTTNNPTGNISIAGTLTPSLESSPAQLPEILISEIRLLPIPQRFIELYNPNNIDINLTGWDIQRRTATGSGFDFFVPKARFENRIIPAKSFLIIARENISQADIILPELTLTNSNAIQLRNASNTIVDKIGWGDVLYFQGLGPAPNPSAQQSIQRKIVEGKFVDTNSNIKDFELQNCPSPKNYFGNCPAERESAPIIAAIKIIEVIFDPEESDRGRERVVLKNSNNLAIDLSSYSLQYLGQNNNFSEIKKKNFEAGNSIPSEGIFKIGMNCSTAFPCEEVNLSWSQALRNQSGTLFLVSHKNEIKNTEDPGIIDVFKYSAAAYLPRVDSFIAVFQLNILEIS